MISTHPYPYHETPSWRCVIGFTAGCSSTTTSQQQQHSGRGAAAATAAATAPKSLLSQHLSKAVEYRCDGAACMSQDGMSEDGDEFCSEGCAFTEDWSFLEDAVESVKESDRSSHASSQPIAIPASCYFKDEVQRQALEKLNQKRKWYQQQLEAERMMARSMAKSRQVTAAARGNKQSGRPGAPA